MLSLLQHQGDWVEFKEMKSAPCNLGVPMTTFKLGD